MRFAVEPNRDPAVAAAIEREVGWDREGEDVRRRFAASPEGHFVARGEKGDVLGTASCSAWGTLAWVGGMVVRPAARRQGVGRALLRACAAHASRRGATVIGLDATGEGLPLYAAEGFAPVDRTARWSRRHDRDAPEPRPSGAFAVYPVGPGELMELLAYDAPRFGGARGPWLAAVMADLPDRAFVAFARPSGQLAGFVLGHATYVGPLVADAPEAAALLLHACERAGAPPLAHLPDANPLAARAFLAARYEPDGVACTRMVRGGPLPGRAETIYALGSWAVG